MRLLVYTPMPTPRVQYAWDVLLRHALGLDFELTADRTAYLAATDYCKINYSQQRTDATEVFVPRGNLLLASGIRPQMTEPFEMYGLPAFFQLDYEAADLPFDLPALAFYLATRYEEYLPAERDAHGRFPAQASLAHRYAFLQRPLINEWALQLRTLLQMRYPRWRPPTLAYRFQPTFDVDMAWAYKHKGWRRQLAAGFLECATGKFKTAANRWRVLTGRQEDPFFTFHYIRQLHEERSLQPIFFFLLGNYGPFDKNISHRQPALRSLIHNLHQQFPTGIHPSYQSNSQPEAIRREIRRLAAITHEPATRSRQHFLRLRFPDTYRALIAAGITADYTMGYASQTGFRASMATPYPWYDIEQEQLTSLMIHPFQAMDVTLRDYLQLSPEAAIENVRQLVVATRAVDGTFSIIWHNSSFSEWHNWGPWRAAYAAILRIATP
ncbi:MAG TPA: polysaccharide deacetylase family protein [Saprospiraceae bacterium]|nr:polysaccharide deacetylase family protein [Saprospiraceae bacterium]HMP23712.1 polysaccharide deacetylase family protein [Saprospiraceae bacterium]